MRVCRRGVACWLSVESSGQGLGPGGAAVTRGDQEALLLLSDELGDDLIKPGLSFPATRFKGVLAAIVASRAQLLLPPLLGPRGDASNPEPSTSPSWGETLLWNACKRFPVVPTCLTVRTVELLRDRVFPGLGLKGIMVRPDDRRYFRADEMAKIGGLRKAQEGDLGQPFTGWARETLGGKLGSLPLGVIIHPDCRDGLLREMCLSPLAEEIGVIVCPAGAAPGITPGDLFCQNWGTPYMPIRAEGIRDVCDGFIRSGARVAAVANELGGVGEIRSRLGVCTLDGAVLCATPPAAADPLFDLSNPLHVFDRPTDPALDGFDVILDLRSGGEPVDASDKTVVHVMRGDASLILAQRYLARGMFPVGQRRF